MGGAWWLAVLGGGAWPVVSLKGLVSMPLKLMPGPVLYLCLPLLSCLSRDEQLAMTPTAVTLCLIMDLESMGPRTKSSEFVARIRKTSLKAVYVFCRSNLRVSLPAPTLLLCPSRKSLIPDVVILMVWILFCFIKQTLFLFS